MLISESEKFNNHIIKELYAFGKYAEILKLTGLKVKFDKSCLKILRPDCVCISLSANCFSDNKTFTRTAKLHFDKSEIINIKEIREKLKEIILREITPGE